jgi:HD-GYP domain-containing protein (c-di-GMP phosphodiesterase class II)
MTPQRIRLRGVSEGLDTRTWESTTFLGIGRLDTQELMLGDSSISRRHAEIAWSPLGWVLRDLGSTNGTFLNGIRVGRADQKLHKGDTVQCGNCSMVVTALEEVSAANAETPGDGMQVECTVQNSWEQALLDAAPLEQMTHIPERDRLLTLLRIGRDFCHATSLEDLLQGILRDAIAALSAAGGALVLIDDDAKLGAVTVSSRPDEAGHAYSKSLAQRALRTGESLLCQDVSEALQIQKGRHLEGVPVASVICALLRSPRKRLGVLQLDRAPGQPPFTRHDLALADALAASVSATIESVHTFQQKEHSLFLQTLTALAQTVDLRDDYTGSHTQRVTDYALLLAEELKLSPRERTYLANGTPLHDIGKIGISDAILRKPGRLTEEETEYMKSHTWKGAAILEAIPPLAPLIPIVRNHHERWDGQGYPDNLMSEDIPILARVVAVADAFDAMTTDRPYRPAMSVEKALMEIRAKSGSHFDPELGEAMWGVKPQLKDLLIQRNKLYATVTNRVCLPLDAARQAEPRARTVAIPKKAWDEYLARTGEKV